MKFTIKRNKIINILKISKFVISCDNIVPILQNILLKINNSKLTFVASNMNLTVISKIKLYNNKNKNISFIVPIKFIYSLILDITDYEILFLIKNRNIVISTIQGYYKIAIYDNTEYPKCYEYINNINKFNGFVIKSDIMLSVINRHIQSINESTIQTVMNGMYINVNKNDICFVSTDAHILAISNYSNSNNVIKNNFNNFSIIIPKNTLYTIKNILNYNSTNKLNILYNNKNLLYIKISNYCIKSRLINGKFVKYESIIPNNYKNKLYISKNKLFLTIKRLINLSSKKEYQIIFEFVNKKNIKIYIKNLEYSIIGYEILDCNYTGKKINISFNYKYILKAISSISQDDIVIEISNNNNKPVVIKPYTDNCIYKVIIMPLLSKTS